MVNIAEGVVLPEEFLQELLSHGEGGGSEILIAEAEEVEHVIHQDSLLFSTVDEPFKTRVAMLI